MAWRGVVLALVALAVFATAASSSAAAAPCSSPDAFEHVPGLGPACETDDGYELRLEDGTTFTTHGPDPLDAFVDADPEETPSTAQVLGAGTHGAEPGWALGEDLVGAPPWAPYCVDESSGERKTVVLHALPAGGSASSGFRTIRDAVVETSTKIQQEARELDAYTAPRIACDGEGWIAVERVWLGTSSWDDSFWSIVNDLAAKGYDDARTTYLIFYDDELGCGCGGIATLDHDDSPGPGNANNHGPEYAVVTGNFDWSESDDLWTTALHEWGHNMGAVQDSAPNFYDNYGGWHCWDEEDIMCYGPETEQVCEDEHFDCNHDDYFHPDPPAGSYLDSHWNVASEANGFVERAEPSELPTAPRGLSATPGPEPGSVLLEWVPPRDAGDAQIERYVIYRDTSGVPVHQLGVKWASAPEVRSVPAGSLSTVSAPVDAAGDEQFVFQDDAYGGIDQVFPRTYRVSAVNDLGEGRLSNSATVAATPTTQGLPFVSP